MAQQFYRVSRVSRVPAAPLVIYIDGEPDADGRPGMPGFGIRAQAALDPDVADPDDPLYMSDADRKAHPDGVVWSQVMSAHQVQAVEADPDLAKHFRVDPLG